QVLRDPALRFRDNRRHVVIPDVEEIADDLALPGPEHGVIQSLLPRGECPGLLNDRGARSSRGHQNVNVTLPGAGITWIPRSISPETCSCTCAESPAFARRLA